MVEPWNRAADSAEPGRGEIQIHRVDPRYEERRQVCELLEALVDDLCGPRNRQAASLVLDFMATDHLGRPGEDADAFPSDLTAWHAVPAVMAPSSDWPEEEEVAARLRERMVVEGLEAIVFGRVPQNPLDFIIAALSLVELERSRGSPAMAACAPIPATEPPTGEPDTQVPIR